MTRSRLTASIQHALLATFALSAALHGGATVAQDDAAELDATEVTGSRLARGSDGIGLPVVVIDRAQIDASGDLSVADLLRDSTLASAGNFKPQSGSSAQSLATIDLRGLGSGRTLVLIDGRRVATNPMSATSGTDLNAIPLAAVERIEILADGASAIYGADAVSGVVNIVLRKDFDGAELRYGTGRTAVEGGDLQEMSALFGSTGERTRIFGGASAEKRGMVFTRDQIGGGARGVSQFGNNYYDWSTGVEAVPGFDCGSRGFYLLASGQCSFDFNSVAANEAKIDRKSVFVNGEHAIGDDWNVQFAASSTRVESFGRYAPTPGSLTVDDGTPNDINFGTACGAGGCAPGTTDGLPTYYFHRFAAAGNRDGFTDALSSEYFLGFEGRLGERVDLEAGLRLSDYDYVELGRGYIVASLAQEAANNGDYLLSDPFGAPEAVLDGMTATINRDASWRGQELFANLRFDLFELAGGRSRALLGAAHIEDRFADRYDSLSEAGVVLGSSGGSSGGSRDTRSAYFEWALPFAPRFDVTLAGRHDDVGGPDGEATFSPKVALRWQPLDSLGVRASWGENFRMPGLDLLTQADVYSSELVADPATCAAFGLGYPCAVSVPVVSIGNADVDAERSENISAGIEYAPADWLQVSLDWYDIRIDDMILQLSAQDIINSDRDVGTYGNIPDGLGVIRAPDGRILQVITGYGNRGWMRAEGLDLRLRTAFDFGGAGSLETRLQASLVLDQEFNTTGIGDGWEIDDEYLGHPELRAMLANTWSVADFQFGWTVHHIAKNGQVGEYTTHDLQASWRAPWNATITLGATNVTDEYPERAAYDGRPWNFYLYDAYGRTTTLRYTQSF